MSSGNDRKRQRSDDGTATGADGEAKQRHATRLIPRIDSTAATRSDPPGQQLNQSVSTAEKSIAAHRVAATSAPLLSRDHSFLVSSNTDTQRALTRLRASQTQHHSDLLGLNAQPNTSDLLRYQLEQQREHQQPQLQLPQHDYLYQQQQLQALNNPQMLQTLQHHQHQSFTDRQMLMRLQQRRQRLSLAIDPLLLHQTVAGGAPSSQLHMPMHSQANLLANPMLQAQLMQLRGHPYVPSQPDPQMPASALALNLGSISPQSSVLPDLLATTGLPSILQQGSTVNPTTARSAAASANLRTAVGPSPPLIVPVTIPKLSGRDPVLLAMPTDKDSLSLYQCLTRKHIEIFEATAIDVERGAQGRNKPIVLGQVGLRCVHCKHLPLKQRARASTYYPAKLSGLYQSAQNITNGHLCTDCCEVPEGLRKEMSRLQVQKSQPGGGKKFWAEMARLQGVYEDCHGLRFRPLSPQESMADAKKTSISSSADSSTRGATLNGRPAAVSVKNTTKKRK